ncbi:hypothetical protein HOE67_02640 [Candidatus Peregrinibacteria bacterium]|jgi:uncharacterized protein|nr:hypothetical protein [Candidatus Peregrinibacteria bacterium]MBT4055984.1 hypothetical protein [Candidatus Peregrinibacteria bacterium]
MRYLHVKIPKTDGVKIPYIVLEGQRDKKSKTAQKTCLITGGIHGDELNGIALVKRLLDYCEKEKIEKKLKGTLLIFPVLNVEGFKKQTRVNPLDRKDLNRSFNQKNKCPSTKIANALWKKFYTKADMVIDCHDSGKRNMLLPHTRIHPHQDKTCTTCTREMAMAFGSKIVIERKGKKGMLAVELGRIKKTPVLTIEIGGALKIADKFLDEALKGIINIFTHYDFLKGEAKLPKKQYYLKNRFGIPATHSGILKMEKTLGQRVHKGDKIGEIYVPMRNKTVDVISPMCGIIFSLQYVDAATKGEIIYSILEDKKCHVRRRTMRMVEEVVNIQM